MGGAKGLHRGRGGEWLLRCDRNQCYWMCAGGLVMRRGSGHVGFCVLYLGELVTRLVRRDWTGRPWLSSSVGVMSGNVMW